MTATLHYDLKGCMSELTKESRWNVLTVLILHANVRNRCWPTVETIAAMATNGNKSKVIAAKNWLIAHKALELVPYDKRAGDDEKKLPQRQHIYQLTGTIELTNAQDQKSTHQYLYVVGNSSPVETFDGESFNGKSFNGSTQSITKKSKPKETKPIETTAVDDVPAAEIVADSHLKISEPSGEMTQAQKIGRVFDLALEFQELKQGQLEELKDLTSTADVLEYCLAILETTKERGGTIEKVIPYLKKTVFNCRRDKKTPQDIRAEVKSKIVQIQQPAQAANGAVKFTPNPKVVDDEQSA